MNKKIILTVVQILFVFVIGAVLIVSLGRTVFLPKEVNYYENRKAYQPPAVSISSFLNSEFQDGLENALSDQVWRAERSKEFYNDLESDISYTVLRTIYEANPDKYFKYNDVLVYNTEYLLFAPRYVTEDAASRFDKQIDCINNVATEHPDLDVYVYYIEKETDINFETGNKTGVYDYIKNGIDTSKCKIDNFEINSFEEYSERFYKIDHHWNYFGSYEAYLQVCDLLEIEDVMKKGDEFIVAEKMNGSKLALAKNTEAWTDSLKAYKFDFPDMAITVNGTATADYGNQNLKKEDFLKEDETVSYGLYYGTDSGEVIFDTGKTEQDNILIIGESYDNAILKLLATHYNKTYSVDLRYYEHYSGKAFDFDAYVKENEIKKVLFIGNIDFFCSEDFNVG